MKIIGSFTVIAVSIGRVLICFLIIFPPFLVNANDYYLAVDGSDSNSGNIDSPWKTITKAISHLKAGDNLYLRGGTYIGEPTYYWDAKKHPGGISGKPITIRAYRDENPVFDGQGEMKGFISLYGVDWVTIEGLTIKNYLVEDNGVIWLGRLNLKSNDFAENISIINNRIENSGKGKRAHAIYVSWGSKDILIKNNHIKKVSGYGVHGWHGPGVNGMKIINNIIQNAKAGAIILADGAKNIEIRNNIIYNNATGIDFNHKGSDISWGVKNAKVTRNIIVNCKDYGGLRIATHNQKDVFSDYNLYYNAPIIWNGERLSLDEYRKVSNNADHSKVADPLFIDPAQDDFHFQPGSPAKEILQNTSGLEAAD
ncbi:MAG: DUF1565 domain-containing protein [Verrucomicrobiota bacterium]